MLYIPRVPKRASLQSGVHVHRHDGLIGHVFDDNRTCLILA